MSSGGVKEIPLTQGFAALVDEADYAWASTLAWSAVRDGANVYAVRHGEGGRLERLHRRVAGAAPGQVVDHINGDGLDNRRANLRVCTRGENLRNRKVHRTSASGFKGVRRQNGRRWQATITAHGRTHFLGMFDTAEEAARAYDAAARQMHGEFARLNFPEAA